MKNYRKKNLGWALITVGVIAVVLCMAPDGNNSVKKPVFSKEEFASRSPSTAISWAGAAAIILGIRTLLRAEKKH